MFGEGFHRVESARPLEAGHYNARITSVRMTQGTLGEQIEVTVSVDGHPNSSPSKFWLGDSPKSGNGQYSVDELLEFWCKRMTAFFDSFGINAGDFNISAWHGRTGRITVRPQKSKPQYMEIVPYETSFERKDVQQESQVPSPQYAQPQVPQMPDGIQQQQTMFRPRQQFQPQQQMNGYPDDLPF